MQYHIGRTQGKSSEAPQVCVVTTPDNWNDICKNLLAKYGDVVTEGLGIRLTPWKPEFTELGINDVDVYSYETFQAAFEDPKIGELLDKELDDMYYFDGYLTASGDSNRKRLGLEPFNPDTLKNLDEHSITAEGSVYIELRYDFKRYTVEVVAEEWCDDIGSFVTHTTIRKHFEKNTDTEQ